MKYTITRIKGGTDNCYIVSNGEDAILFDTASANNLQQVKDECSKIGRASCRERVLLSV